MSLTRRDALHLLLAQLPSSLIGSDALQAEDRPDAARPGHVVRGMGVGMRTAVQGYEGGTSWSRVTRSGHRSQVRFTRSRVVIPTFSIGALDARKNFADTDFANSFFFRVLLEYSFQDSTTGLTTNQRLAYRFKGSEIAAYDGPGTNPQGTIVSDWLDHPLVERGTKFGLWTTIENQRGPASGPATLPVVENSSSFIQRHEGELTNQDNGHAAGQSFIRSNAAASATRIANFGASINGRSGGFTPCMMLIDYPAGVAAPALFGDSIGYGIGEGSRGSETYGDALGSPLRNAGYLARGINETLGLNYTVNISRGGDGYKYAHLPGALQYRLQVLKLANPTSVALGMVHNDVAAGIDVSEIANTMRITLDRLASTLPSARFYQSLCTPDSASPSGQWAAIDGSDQTARQGWGSSSSPRGRINALIRERSPRLGRIDGVFDPNVVAEYGWAQGRETGLWVGFGTPFGAASDGTHPNSHMNALIAASMGRGLYR